MFNRTIGVCPYCGTTEGTLIKQRRPGQDIYRCVFTSCAKFYVYIERTNGCYPLENSEDQDSLPAVRVK